MHIVQNIQMQKNTPLFQKGHRVSLYLKENTAFWQFHAFEGPIGFCFAHFATYTYL